MAFKLDKKRKTNSEFLVSFNSFVCCWWLLVCKENKDLVVNLDISTHIEWSKSCQLMAVVFYYVSAHVWLMK